jgi:tryptophanyl-tRNA synthetase
VVNKYHQTFTPGEYENICEMCRKGAIGCVACKKILAESLNNLLDPCREKRAYYEAHRDEVRDIIKTGTEKACRIGEETVEKVREAMFLKV